MGKQKLESVEQLNEIASRQEKFILFKHSLTCPISQEAYDEFNAFLENHQSVDAYYLFVQEARPLSNYIAEKFGVKHESPQALLVENNEVKWNASHWKITKKSLAEATKG